MMHIKILHPITSLNRDGAQQMLFRLIEQLPRDRYQHVVVSLRERMPFADEIEALGVTVYCLDMAPSRPSLSALFKLRRIIDIEKPQLIQSWLYHANIYAALALYSRLRSIPLVWGIRGSLDSTWNRGITTGLVIKLSSYLSHFPAAITFNSKTSIEQHRADGYNNDRMIYLANGFDLTRFKSDHTVRERVRLTLNLSDDILLIGLAGRYSVEKDYPTFVRAFKLVKDAQPNAHALLIGRGLDQKYSPLTRLIEELNLSSSISLLGSQEDLAQFLPALDVFCSSSITEGFPNVVAEALLCQVPCVVTDVGMGKELVKNAGFSVPASNPPLLAEALLTLLRLDPEQRKKLGENGRQSIAQNYSLESVVQIFDSLYLSLCNDETKN
jgi:glycosyltransferase involved in cell wall biosynthesis